MGYQDFGFAEHIKLIDENPYDQIGLVVPFAREDLMDLLRTTQAELTQWPSTKTDAQKLTVEELQRMVPYGELLSDKNSKDNVRGKDSMVLIAAFATLGYAATQGRTIHSILGEAITPTEINPKNVQEQILDPRYFLDNQRDVLRGAQGFFDGVHQALKRPQQAIMYNFIRPKTHDRN